MHPHMNHLLGDYCDIWFPIRLPKRPLRGVTLTNSLLRSLRQLQGILRDFCFQDQIIRRRRAGELQSLVNLPAHGGVEVKKPVVQDPVLINPKQAILRGLQRLDVFVTLGRAPELTSAELSLLGQPVQLAPQFFEAHLEARGACGQVAQRSTPFPKQDLPEDNLYALSPRPHC